MMKKSSIPLRSALLIYASLALTFTFYHAQTINRPFWRERAEFHQGIIAGTWKSPYQYRVVAPWIAEAGGWGIEHALNLSPGKTAILVREVIYIGERFVATFALLVFFHLYLENWFSSGLAFAGTLVLASLHLYTYYRYYYQPSSVINGALLALGALLIVRGNTMSLFPLMAVGSLTRETFGLLVPLYIAHRWGRKGWLRNGVGLGLVWLFSQILLRYVYGPKSSFPGRSVWENIQKASWPVFLFGLLWLIPLIRYRHLPAFLRRAIWLFIPPLVLFNFLFGEVEETRLFLDAAIVLIPSTLLPLCTQQEGQVPVTAPNIHTSEAIGPTGKPAVWMNTK